MLVLNLIILCCITWTVFSWVMLKLVKPVLWNASFDDIHVPLKPINWNVTSHEWPVNLKYCIVVEFIFIILSFDVWIYLLCWWILLFQWKAMWFFKNCIKCGVFVVMKKLSLTVFCFPSIACSKITFLCWIMWKLLSLLI